VLEAFCLSGGIGKQAERIFVHFKADERFNRRLEKVAGLEGEKKA
jgi:hypothetical protein